MDAHSLECLDFPRVREVVARYASTGLGRSLAGSIHPVTRIALVRRWLAQVAEMQRLMEERGLPPFGGVSDVREILTRCTPPLRVTVEEVAQVGSTLAATHEIASYLRDLPESYPELRHLAGRVGDFKTVADRIRTVIDERGQVRDDASPKLARVRGEISEAARQIDETVARLLRESDIRRLLQYPNHTFHGDRLVLPLRSEYRGRLPGIVHRTSDSGATLYVEPAGVVELNNRISNLRSEEQEEVGRLLWELVHEVHVNAKEVHRTLETLSVLDLILAKVRFARDFEARCPQISDESLLSVRGARHPILVDIGLQKRAAGQPPPEVVPIDYRLGVDFDLLIITGPNTGGKTVTLKTVGLMCLMVQAGVPVPVEAGSEFGVFSNVLIDVGDEQSMQQSLSTFSAHLTRLLDMLRHAGPRALLLIDELGAGTDPDEGAAIGRAVLDELLHLRCRCVATTHLGALKGFALTRGRSENACVEFDGVSLRPTYHLRLGEPGSSNAIEIASRLGMPRRLVNAAHRNLSRKARALHSALEGTRMVKRQAEEARKQAESAQLAAGRAHDEAQAVRAKFERQQADFQQWVSRVVHLRAGDPVRVRNFDRDGRIIRLRIDQHRAEVDVGLFSVDVPLGDVLPPEAPPPPPRPRPVPQPPPAKRPGKPRPSPPAAEVHGRGHETAGPATKPVQADSGKGDQAMRPALPAMGPAAAAALKPGDHVYLLRFHREGRVVRLVPGKHLAIVDAGLLEMEVPFEALAAPPERRKPPTAVTKPAKPRRAPDTPGATSESATEPGDPPGAPAPGAGN